MPHESMTLKDLDDRGHDARAWCFGCQRFKHIDTIIWQRFAARGWAMELNAAAPRFRCIRCRSSAQVALFPATRPPAPMVTGADMVAAIFFGARKAAKAAKRDPIVERALERLRPDPRRR